MTVRPATEGDVTSIAGLEAELLGPEAWSEQQVRDELASDRAQVLVATDDDVVVGYVTTMAAGDVVDLNRIAVAVSHQREGIARLLLDRALRGAHAQGALRALLEVSADNTGAVSFYEQAGFAEIDRRPRYYRDGSDAIVMQLALPAPTRQEDTVHG